MRDIGGIGVAGTFRIRFVVSLILMGTTLGCASDGAVRLARCVAEAAEQLEATGAGEVRRECELKIPAGSKVVALPAKPLTSEQYYDAGLTLENVRTIDWLAMSDMPVERINVLPPQDSIRPSRTGYHSHWVATPELLVCETVGSTVTVLLVQEEGRLLWKGLR